MAAAAAALLGTWALAACGGQGVTKADVIARGNAICTKSLRQIRAVQTPGGSAADLAGYLAQVAPIVQLEAKQIRALPRPAAQRSLLQRYVEAVTSDASTYQALAAAAHSGNDGAVAQGLAQLRASPSASLAAQYGLTQCAAPGSTAVS